MKSLPHWFLVRLASELSLKGKKTRHRFVDRLVHNLADALGTHGLEYEFHRQWARLLISSSSPEAGEIARRVFGVHGVAAIEKRTWRSLGDLFEHGEEIFSPRVAERTFAVRFHRGEGAARVTFSSQDAERRLGARLAGGARGVDLRSPEVEAHVEVRGEDAYFYGRPDGAEGGLPLGTEGRALALFSGGFDSPVAAWAMLRRGVRLDYLFCNLGGEDHLHQVLRVASVVAERWSYGYRPRLVIVDFRPVVEELRRRTEAPLWQVLLKRQMLRLAERLAASFKAQALITGEAVGQVSSQTLQNLAVISQAIRIPVFRPLSAWDKTEILALARRIGTHGASEKVPEYCGLGGGRPQTSAKAKAVLAQEAKLDPELLRRIAAEQTVLDLRAFDPAALEVSGLEVERIPQGAVALDLRGRGAYRAWHAEGAHHVAYPDVLDAFPAFDREPLYVAYCELGLKSAHLAEVMTAAGFRARHIRGGAASLRHSMQGAEDPALSAILSPALRR